MFTFEIKNWVEKPIFLNFVFTIQLCNNLSYLNSYLNWYYVIQVPLPNIPIVTYLNRLTRKKIGCLVTLDSLFNCVCIFYPLPHHGQSLLCPPLNPALQVVDLGVALLNQHPRGLFASSPYGTVHIDFLVF